jgi:tetratricopeptide (TPR) repeat protein
MIKIVKAESNSIAAGGDITINLVITDGALNQQSLLRQINEKAGLDAETVFKIFGETGQNITTARNLVERLTLDAIAQSVELTDKYATLSDLAATRRAEAEALEEAFGEISRALSERRYGDAHKYITLVMESTAIGESSRAEFVFDYFLTGYLHLANSGIGSEIRLLHEKAFNEYARQLDPMLLCLLAEMQQEIATRDLKDVPLENCLRSLEDLLPRCDGQSEALEYCQILTALCLRRLGERRRLSLLDESIILHESLMKRPTKRTIEITNNYGIALIRYFEATQDPSYLSKAKTVLEALKPPVDGSLVSEYQCYPKVLNNLGNVAKQMIRVTKKTSLLSQAVECYSEAENYWNQTDSPYEWAMLQKNKAESRLFHMQVFGMESELYRRAIGEVEASLRYRTDQEASWQSNRSKEVLRGLLKLEDRD